MNPIIKKILLSISRSTSSSCFVIFGSGGRSDLLPGSDLDIVAIVPYLQYWKYKPTVIKGLWIDLNYVCNVGLQEKLESSWYWRAQLRQYKILGVSTVTSEILETNAKLGGSEIEKKIICDGWRQLSDNHYTNAQRTKIEWIRQGMEWHSMVSLMNGILQLEGLTPHSYHNHFAEINKTNLPIGFINSYLDFIYYSYYNLVDLPLWIKEVSNQLNNPNLKVKINAIEERIMYLKNLERLIDVTLYLRHAIWMLLVHIACGKTNEIFPSTHMEYGSMIEKIDKIIPESIKNYFLRINDIKSNTLKMELSKYLENKVL